MALLLCNRDFFNVSFLAATSKLSFKSSAVCVCMYPPRF